MILSLQRNDNFNVTILCKGMKFSTTLDVLCLHSPYLKSILTSDSDDDGHQILSWNDLELFTVRRFMDYIYHFDYGPRERYHPVPNTGDEEEITEAEQHISMHRLASQFLIKTLSRRSKAKFDAHLQRIIAREDVNELLEIVPLLYVGKSGIYGSAGGENELQRLLVEVWGGMSTQQVQSFDKGRLKELFGRNPEFPCDLTVQHSRAATPKAPRKRMRFGEDETLEDMSQTYESQEYHSQENQLRDEQLREDPSLEEQSMEGHSLEDQLAEPLSYEVQSSETQPSEDPTGQDLESESTASSVS